MGRFNAKLKCNYYPLAPQEAGRIHQQLSFPSGPFAALDPCIGDGSAFATITAGAQAWRFGIELDAYRAEQAGPDLTEIVQGDCLETHCAVESFGLIYANPPYDWSIAEEQRERLETAFLNHIFRWLVPAGVLLLVIPAERAADCAPILGSHFKSVRIWKLGELESVKYRQVLIAGVRRTRRERDQLRDRDITDARRRFLSLRWDYNSLAVLDDSSGATYAIPATGQPALKFRGLPLDQLEDQLGNSPAYRQAARILAPEAAVICGRLLTPLHQGHVALLATGGMLNGIFGAGEELHIAAWKSKKVSAESTEEEEDGTTVIRERERFIHELSVAFADGTTATLE
jgi:Uncharacterised methyltransferase family (DUF6094)